MGWVVSTTPRPLCPRERDPIPIVREAGWAPGPVWAGAEYFAPTGIRSPDRPARCVVAIPTELSRPPMYRCSRPGGFLTPVWNQRPQTQTGLSTKRSTQKYQEKYPKVPREVPKSIKRSAERYQEKYPKVSREVPKGTKRSTQKYQEKCPKVPREVPKSTKRSTQKYQEKYPKVPREVPKSTKRSAQRYQEK